tara:strand:+ start:617 stop:985 length:369 start_codon:yes stop_codon:yes gene_type:complete
MGEPLVFGVEPNMREVPPGKHATFKVGKVKDWCIIETEWGEKYSFPIVLLSHPSYDSIPKKGIEMKWQSKSKSAEGLFWWMYEEGEEEPVMKVFDHDMSKELNKTMELHRFETGTYQLVIPD